MKSEARSHAPGALAGGTGTGGLLGSECQPSSGSEGPSQNSKETERAGPRCSLASVHTHAHTKEREKDPVMHTVYQLVKAKPVKMTL